jgi:hypothetical protein
MTCDILGPMTKSFKKKQLKSYYSLKLSPLRSPKHDTMAQQAYSVLGHRWALSGFGLWRSFKTRDEAVKAYQMAMSNVL